MTTGFQGSAHPCPKANAKRFGVSYDAAVERCALVSPHVAWWPRRRRVRFSAASDRVCPTRRTHAHHITHNHRRRRQRDTDDRPLAGSTTRYASAATQPHPRNPSGVPR